MSWEIPLRFVKVTWTSPVCIPSAIPRAKVPCVVPLWSFPCLWRVQLGEVPSPYPTFPMRTATTWSPDGILVQWSGGYRSDAGRKRRRLLNSAPLNKLFLDVNSEVVLQDCRSVVYSRDAEETHIKTSNPTQLERNCCGDFILIWFLAQKLLQSAWVLSRTWSIPAILGGCQIKRKHPGVVAAGLGKKTYRDPRTGKRTRINAKMREQEQRFVEHVLIVRSCMRAAKCEVLWSTWLKDILYK